MPLFAEAVIGEFCQGLTKIAGRPLQISVPFREILSCLSLFVGGSSGCCVPPFNLLTLLWVRFRLRGFGFRESLERVAGFRAFGFRGFTYTLHRSFCPAHPSV